MRWLSLLLLLGCSSPVLDAPDEIGTSDLVIDLDGDFGPAAPAPRFVRAVHLRFDTGPVDLSFNQTGVLVARDVPPGGATPYLPLPVEQVSLQAHRGDQVIVDTEPVAVPEGAGAMIAAFGTSDDPRQISVPTDLRGEPGQVRSRALHATPGLTFVRLLDLDGPALATVLYGELSESFVFDPEVEQRWALDLTGDGRPNLLLEPFMIGATDGDGRAPVIDLYVIPTGQVLPGPARLPIPALLVVPLDAPDGIFVVAPTSG